MKAYSKNPKGERIELSITLQETGYTIPPRYNYYQAWKDLRNEFIDKLTDKENGIVYPEDIKKAMDEMLINYKI